MKKIVSILLLSFAGCNAYAQNDDVFAKLTPAPVSVNRTAGSFTYSKSTSFAVSLSMPDVKKFSALLQSYGLHGANKPTSFVSLTSEGADKLPAEGYRIEITPGYVRIIGKGAGLFYGLQTFMQLLPVDRDSTVLLPCGVIEDYPRFAYRGLMLDVCRHFFSIDFVKKYIDLMAAYKLNTFHWHLTDDQGWRIEIKKYPKLTQIGGMRAQTRIGNYYRDTPAVYDGTPYGGYYTQEQIREVVQYAAEKYITVIPEIEMPGHSLAALSAYPELSCEPGRTYKAAETWGVFRDVYCPSETTFSFLQDVLTEVMQLFPGKYIHIGGDECPKEAWKASAFCRQLIKDKHLKDEHGLQSYFISRIEQFVNSKGHSIIGWDEILEGGLAPNATVMSWRGEDGGIEAAKQHHDVIMTPGSGGLYLDHAQSKSDQEPLSIGGNAPLIKTYSYDPVPAKLPADERKYIKGVQANVWTEYIATPARVEYSVLPRMLALSETAWSPAERKNFKRFSEICVPYQLRLLEEKGYHYRVPVAIGASDTAIVMKGSDFRFELAPSVEAATIYYTIDGYTPRETDQVYTKPLEFTIPKGQRRVLKTIVITPAGKRSIVTQVTMDNR